MSLRLLSILLVGVALTASGCVAGEPDDADGGSGGSDGSTGGSSASGGAGGTDPCPNDDCDPTAACATSLSGTPFLRRLTARELDAALSDIFPEVAGSWTSSMSSDPVSHFGFDNEAARLVVSKQTARDIDATAATVGTAVSGTSLATILPCSAAAADSACGAEFLAKYGKRLFRRPLTDAETTTYSGFFEEALTATSFPEAISWLTKALIHSPATLYRSEVGTLVDTKRQLDQYEIATSLAFTYSGTTPSDELLAQADSGALDSPDALIAAAGVLAASAEGRSEMQRFFEAAMQYGRVSTLTKTNYPEFVDLRVDMLAETRAFITGVILDAGGGIDELLTANVTYPSVALSTHYGLPAPSADFAVVERTEGIGLLAQGALLSTEASPANSSPTQRGLLVMERLLCRRPPPVPATVPELPTPSSGPVTTRQRYEELHVSSDCSICHDHFDPIGFGFEHFDEAGRYRQNETDAELAVNSASFIPGTTPEVAFAGQEDLAMALADMEEVQLCVSGQLKTFSFGTDQACLGEGRRTEFMAGAIGFVEYWASLAGDPHFSARKP